MSGNPYILRPRFAGWFIPHLIENAGSMPVSEGFATKQAPLFRLTMVALMHGDPRLPPSMNGFFSEDILNADIEQPALPVIVFGAAAGHDGRQSATSIGRQRIGAYQRLDLMTWTSFIQLIKSTNIDVDQFGLCKAMKDTKIAPIAVRVKALEGMGQFPPRNVLEEWAPTMDHFKREDEVALNALKAAERATATPSLASALAANQDAPAMTPGRLVLASRTSVAPVPALPATAAAAQPPATDGATPSAATGESAAIATGPAEAATAPAVATVAPVATASSANVSSEPPPAPPSRRIRSSAGN